MGWCTCALNMLTFSQFAFTIFRPAFLNDEDDVHNDERDAERVTREKNTWKSYRIEMYTTKSSQLGY